jgi:hypothetical protein
MKISCGRFVAMMRDTIAKLNWTLDRFRLNWDRSDCLGSQFNENELVREAVAARKDKEHRVEQMAIWSDVSGLVSSKPAPLYRFLRRKNCDSLAAPLRWRWMPGAKPSGNDQCPRPRRRRKTTGPTDAGGAAATTTAIPTNDLVMVHRRRSGSFLVMDVRVQVDVGGPSISFFL